MRSSWSLQWVALPDQPNSRETGNFCQHICFCLFSQDWQAHYINIDISTWELILCNCNFAYVNEDIIISKSEHLEWCARHHLIIRTVGDGALSLISSIPSIFFSLSKFHFFLDFPSSPLSFIPSLSINDRCFLMPPLYGCTWNKSSFLLAVG